MKIKMKINYGVEFNTNNYERTIELSIVQDTDEDQNGEFTTTTIIPCSWIGGDVYTYCNTYEGDNAIESWFYDNISELTSCDDEFIKDNNNKYFTDYVRYELVD